MPLLYEAKVDLSALSGVNKVLVIYRVVLNDSYSLRLFILVLILASAQNSWYKQNFSFGPRPPKGKCFGSKMGMSP